MLTILVSTLVGSLVYILIENPMRRLVKWAGATASRYVAAMPWHSVCDRTQHSHKPLLHPLLVNYHRQPVWLALADAPQPSSLPYQRLDAAGAAQATQLGSTDEELPAPADLPLMATHSPHLAAAFGGLGAGAGAGAGADARHRHAKVAGTASGSDEGGGDGDNSDEDGGDGEDSAGSGAADGEEDGDTASDDDDDDDDEGSELETDEEPMAGEDLWTTDSESDSDEGADSDDEAAPAGRSDNDNDDDDEEEEGEDEDEDEDDDDVEAGLPSDDVERLREAGTTVEQLASDVIDTVEQVRQRWLLPWAGNACPPTGTNPAFLTTGRRHEHCTGHVAGCTGGGGHWRLREARKGRC